MSSVKFSREEMLTMLRDDKILGDDMAQLVDMSFIKSPEKNPELIMDCFILALGQLGYSAENIHQPPASAMMNDKLHLQLNDTKHWAHVWILKRIKHFFKRIGIIDQFKNDDRLCFGDLICPRSRRFNLILGHLINFIMYKSELDPAIEDVDHKCKQMQDELEYKESKRADLERKMQEQKPYQDRILADIENLKNNIRDTKVECGANQKKLQMSKDKNANIKSDADKAEGQNAIIDGEIKMLTEEKSRLKELVVTNPDEWESNFQKTKGEIATTDDHISWIKDEIPRIQSQLRSIQKYGSELSNLVKKLEEIKGQMVEKSEIEKTQSSTQNSIQYEQKELDKMETDLNLLRQSHQMEIDETNKKIESLKEDLEKKEGEERELSDIIRDFKNEIKTIASNRESAEAIKSDIDYHKPKIERRAKAYEDELEKINENSKKMFDEAQRKFINILD